MRWDRLRLADSDERDDGQTGELALFGLDSVARTFDTPEFRGMTFYEVRSRSIVNKVPSASRMPFQWTINPYRGCGHACVYCLAGDTEVLLADGRSRPLAEVRVGDAVYGTVSDGSYRRYAVTHVRAHWSTAKRAHRVVLADGTELTASADHRFLTDGGWRWVADQSGRGRKPVLAAGQRLLGTGRFAAPPPDTLDYRRGYLCGMIRGDHGLGTETYDRPIQSLASDEGPRLSVDDTDALRRTHRYLAGLDTAAERPSRRQPALGDLVRWPATPSEAWCRGFLAGVFDADGSFTGALHLGDVDDETLDQMAESLDRLGFDHAVGDRAAAGGLRSVRLSGGLREQLRFLHSVDPAVSRKRSVAGRAVRSGTRLEVVQVEDLGVEVPMYDMTTGTGDFIANGVVSHNCFARRTHEWLDLDTGHDFDSKIVVKVNAPELLRKELANPRWSGEHIAMGTNVDCYQRAEGRYRLMRGIIEALRDARNPFSILTKGTLILRDLDLLRQAAEVTSVSVNVSVGFVDEELWREVEPGTPAPRARLGVCRTLSDAGIGCGVLMAPILPYLTDTPAQLDATVRAIAESGAASVTPIVLHLRPGAREWYLDWLGRTQPDLVPRYRDLYARGAYSPKAYQRRISERVARLAERYGVGPTTPGEARHRSA